MHTQIKHTCTYGEGDETLNRLSPYLTKHTQILSSNPLKPRTPIFESLAMVADARVLFIKAVTHHQLLQSTRNVPFSHSPISKKFLLTLIMLILTPVQQILPIIIHHHPNLLSEQCVLWSVNLITNNKHTISEEEDLPG